MRRTFDKHYEPSESDEPQYLLPDLDDEDELDDVAALAVHNEQLHRYLREL